MGERRPSIIVRKLPASSEKATLQGDTFGFTVQHGGDWTWPSLGCRAA